MVAFKQPRGIRRLWRLSFIVLCIYAIGIFSQYDIYSTRDLALQRISSILLPAEILFPAVKYSATVNHAKLAADPSATHKYWENGLLEVNPEARHPILSLTRDAEKKWQRKLDKVSKTLEDAVQEYKTRYKRLPPKGFDDWWKYAQDNNVQLPDEYDFLYNNLEPFWGISPEDLLKIQAEQEKVPDAYTLSKNDTNGIDVAHVAFSTPDWRERNLLRGADEIMGLLRPVEHLLPPFRAIFSPHDNPDFLSDYHVKKAFLDAAKDGTYVNVKNLPAVKHLGFASACAPGSPGRLVEAPVNQSARPESRPGKTFIYDHQLSMNPCTNPSIFYHHAQYVGHDPGPRPKAKLAMKFTFCSTPLYHDLQPPTFIAWVGDVTPRENDPPWEEKTDERLMWRGSNTGIHHNDHTRWIYAQRIHLVRMAAELNGTERILLSPFHGFSNDTQAHDEWTVGKGIDIQKSFINPSMMDISFTGRPIGCDPQYCEYLKTLFEFRKQQPGNGKEAGSHKYLVDIDGNGWSSRFKRLITSNSLVFKATAYPEWWIDRIQPWVHYVPVQVDYSDLYDAYVFFRGGLYGEGNHDDMARKIAIAGREWSKAYWRKEDMTAYFFRLMLEYARILSPDREAMSYRG